MAFSHTTGALRGSGQMGKAMSVAGMVVGGPIALMFAMDLFVAIPFGGPSKSGSVLVDVGLLLCGGILAYLGWSAFRDVR